MRRWLFLLLLICQVAVSSAGTSTWQGPYYLCSQRSCWEWVSPGPGFRFVGLQPVVSGLRFPVRSLRSREVQPISGAASDPENDSIPPVNKASFVVIPIITYSPETSLRIGAMSVVLFRFRNSPEGTQLSQLKLPLSYTFRNQVRARFSYTLFLPANRHILDGHVEWQLYPQFFYGIGPEVPEEDEEIFTSVDWEFQLNYLTRLGAPFYVGFRFNRESSRITEIEEGGLLAQEGLIPGADGGVTSALGLLARFDRRDNVLNPARGPFVEALFSAYMPVIGSDFTFQKLRIDFRHFLPVFGGRHLLAFNAVGEQNWGEPPFQRLALLGGDQIMRGHIEGRYRDQVMLAAQVEYRLPLLRRNWVDKRQRVPFKERWGVVAFAGLGNVASDLRIFDFGGLKKSLGFGIRYLARPEERINIRLDFAFGTQRPGFYLNIREAF